MYTTRRMNPKLVEGNAFITVGDPYVEETKYIPPRWKGKKLATTHHPQNAENGNFSKLTYASDAYVTGVPYTQTQPIEKRKKGFGTGDAFKSDEFTNAIRTQQYRETLRKETYLHSRRSHDEDDAKLQEYQETQRARQESAGTTFLYDVGRTRVTEFDPRKSRDAHYSFDSTKGRELGGYRPTSQDIGDGAWNFTYKPPERGSHSSVSRFFDNGHLQSTSISR